jgi:hypothetical protein
MEKPIKISVLSLLITILFASAAAAQNKSIYTSTKTNACKTIRSTSEGTGSYVGECRGVGGYKVRLIEGDIRQTLDIVTPARKKFELNFWNFYSSFSSIGEKIEWRVKLGVPVAIIARYNVSNPADPERSTSYLMVSRIGRQVNCVTDIVGPGPRQNEEARRLADAAPGKPCKTSE